MTRGEKRKYSSDPDSSNPDTSYSDTSRSDTSHPDTTDTSHSDISSDPVFMGQRLPSYQAMFHGKERSTNVLGLKWGRQTKKTSDVQQPFQRQAKIKAAEWMANLGLLDEEPVGQFAETPSVQTNKPQRPQEKGQPAAYLSAEQPYDQYPQGQGISENAYKLDQACYPS